MTVCLLLISDGRDEYLTRTLASAREMLGLFDETVHVDDRAHKLGFAGAIAAGWRRVLETQATHVFHLEADFIFNVPIDVPAMVALLDRRPYLAQVALQRQSWNERERAAGGVIAANPDAFEQRSDSLAVWTEHRLFFTTNPSVYPVRLCRPGWPQAAHSEGLFTHRLLVNPLLRFAYWGAKDAPPLVHHIGDERVGNGY